MPASRDAGGNPKDEHSGSDAKPWLAIPSPLTFTPKQEKSSKLLGSSLELENAQFPPPFRMASGPLAFGKLILMDFCSLGTIIREQPGPAKASVAAMTPKKTCRE
jgi:hypothetical protein